MATTTDNRKTGERGRELVLAVIGAHAGSLLALARRYSLCTDDAYDAYQRSLEIFLRRADTVDPERAPAWLRTVVKHEALAVRAARQRIVGPIEVELDRTEARDLLPVDERAAAAERDERSAEALARLKPQEVRALVLKAHGYSYQEISEITGWTYTKVNRCLTEGRRAFLERFAEIEAGRECERWSGTLSALADGEAAADDVAAVRPHLRHCPACRARLREYRAAPRAVAALTPAGAILAGGDEAAAAAVEGVMAADGGAAGHAAATDAGAAGQAGDGAAAPPGGAPGEDLPVAGLVARVHDAVVAGWHDRVLLSAHKLQAGVEAASAGKLAAVAASATALAGGGAAALTDVAADPPARPAPAAVASRGPAGEPRPAISPPATGHLASASGPGTSTGAGRVRARRPSRRSVGDAAPRSQPPEPAAHGEFGAAPDDAASLPDASASASGASPPPAPRSRPAPRPARTASAPTSPTDQAEFAP